MPAHLHHSRAHRHESCTDQVVGAILSGWRYDISGIAPELRGDYEAHLKACAHCRRKQRLHRTVDVLLLLATTLSFAAFLMVAIVLRRVDALNHLHHLEALNQTGVHVHLHNEASGALSRIPDSITISLEAIALTGVFVSLLLWILVAIATPIPSMVSSIFRERIPELRERMGGRAA